MCSYQETDALALVRAVNATASIPLAPVPTAALERGELWTEDGAQVAVTDEACNVGPQHRRIRGSLGVFDEYHGWNGDAQFPAIWSLDSSVHQRHFLRAECPYGPKLARFTLPLTSATTHNG